MRRLLRLITTLIGLSLLSTSLALVSTTATATPAAAQSGCETYLAGSNGLLVINSNPLDTTSYTVVEAPSFFTPGVTGTYIYVPPGAEIQVCIVSGIATVEIFHGGTATQANPVFAAVVGYFGTGYGGFLNCLEFIVPQMSLAYEYCYLAYNVWLVETTETGLEVTEGDTTGAIGVFDEPEQSHQVVLPPNLTSCLGPAAPVLQGLYDAWVTADDDYEFYLHDDSSDHNPAYWAGLADDAANSFMTAVIAALGIAQLPVTNADDVSTLMLDYMAQLDVTDPVYAYVSNLYLQALQLDAQGLPFELSPDLELSGFAALAALDQLCEASQTISDATDAVDALDEDYPLPTTWCSAAMDGRVAAPTSTGPGRSTLQRTAGDRGETALLTQGLTAVNTDDLLGLGGVGPLGDSPIQPADQGYHGTFCAVKNITHIDILNDDFSPRFTWTNGYDSTQSGTQGPGNYGGSVKSSVVLRISPGKTTVFLNYLGTNPVPPPTASNSVMVAWLEAMISPAAPGSGPGGPPYLEPLTINGMAAADLATLTEYSKALFAQAIAQGLITSATGVDVSTIIPFIEARRPPANHEGFAGATVTTSQIEYPIDGNFFWTLTAHPANKRYVAMYPGNPDDGYMSATNHSTLWATHDNALMVAAHEAHHVKQGITFANSLATLPGNLGIAGYSLLPLPNHTDFDAAIAAKLDRNFEGPAYRLSRNLFDNGDLVYSEDARAAVETSCLTLYSCTSPASSLNGLLHHFVYNPVTNQIGLDPATRTDAQLNAELFLG